MSRYTYYLGSTEYLSTMERIQTDTYRTSAGDLRHGLTPYFLHTHELLAVLAAAEKKKEKKKTPRVVCISPTTSG